MNYNLVDSDGSQLLYFETFEVDWGAKSAPSTPVGLSPAGTLPALTWGKVRDATWYGIWINDPSGVNVFNKWYTAAEVGASINSTCSVTPGVTLNPNTRYTWWVIAYGPGGYSSWSALRYIGWSQAK